MAGDMFNQESNELSRFLASQVDGVFYVGHASILVRLSGQKFLFDPVFERPPYLESWVFYPSQILDPRLLDVDAVIVSHCHQDHFDVEFLKRLKPSTKIYIVGGRPEFKRMFDAADLLTEELPVGRKVSLGKDIEIFGTLHEYNTIDASTLIKNSNLSVYHGNDNYVTKKSLQPMREVMGDVTVGCIPFSFIHWYPFLMEGVDKEWKEKEAERLIQKYLDLGIEQAQALNAKIVIPFGANLVYHDDANSVMNQAVLSPIDFVKYARSKLPKQESNRYKSMFAGDFVTHLAGEEPVAHFTERTKEEFVEGLQRHLEARKQNSMVDENVSIEQDLLEDLTWLESKLRAKAGNPLDHMIRIEASVGSAGFNVAFFGYSWTPDLEPDAYQSALIRAFIQRGANVKFFHSNKFTAENPTRGLSRRFKKQKLMEELRDFRPALVLSMNRGGLDAEMKSRIAAPVVTWIVDDFTHLFDPDGQGVFDGVVTRKDPVVVSSLEVWETLRRMYPDLRENIHFVASATEFDEFRQVSLPKSVPISFVGSYLDLGAADAFIKFVIKEKKSLEAFYLLLDHLRLDYSGDFEKVLEKAKLVSIVEKMGWDLIVAKRELANLISARDRLEAVRQTYDLGLHLYGGQSWLVPLTSIHLDALKCLKVNQVIRSRADLVGVYQSSKICFNVNQIQTRGALSYRVFDILASDSLLIQPYHPDSDAFSLFGKNCPIPMYRNFSELRALCQYFLTHEDERLEKVRLCQDLVKSGFSFRDRINDLVKIGKVNEQAIEIRPALIKTRPENYMRRFAFSGITWRRFIIQFVQAFAQNLFPLSFRQKLARVLTEG